MFNAPIMEGRFTDVEMFKLLLNEFMEGMSVNVMCVYKDYNTGTITIHGAHGAVELIDAVCEEE